MRLSKHFSLHELVRSQFATRKKINNQPNAETYKNLKNLCVNLLQPTREHLKQPLFVTSGYRCTELNSAIGGVKNSQHIQGLAADIECFQLSTKQLFEAVQDSGLKFDQLILEYHKPNNPSSGWVHISYNTAGNRQQSFIIG